MLVHLFLKSSTLHLYMRNSLLIVSMTEPEFCRDRKPSETITVGKVWYSINHNQRQNKRYPNRQSQVT